jgi:hypothetical protein
MVLKVMGWGYELDSSGSRQGPVAGPCEHDKETSSPIKRWEILE